MYIIKVPHYKNPQKKNHKENFSVYVLSGQGESLSSVSPYIICNTRKTKRKKTPNTLMIRKQPIQEPVNPKKREKHDTITDVKKDNPKETHPSFFHRVYY